MITYYHVADPSYRVGDDLVCRDDLLAEGLGTGLGSALWFFAGQRMAGLWQRFVGGGAHSLLAVLALYAIVAGLGVSLLLSL